MIQTIPAAHIGNFRSAGEERLYQQAQNVIREVQDTTDAFLARDNTPCDVHADVPGLVQLQGERLNSAWSLTGYCAFQDGKPTEMAAEKKGSLGGSPLADDPSEQFLTVRSSLTPSVNGTTYESPSGTVRVGVDGTLFVDVPQDTGGDILVW